MAARVRATGAACSHVMRSPYTLQLLRASLDPLREQSELQRTGQHLEKHASSQVRQARAGRRYARLAARLVALRLGCACLCHRSVLVRAPDHRELAWRSGTRIECGQCASTHTTAARPSRSPMCATAGMCTSHVAQRRPYLRRRARVHKQSALPVTRAASCRTAAAQRGV